MDRIHFFEVHEFLKFRRCPLIFKILIMFPNVYEICLLYPHVFVIAYNATLVSHSSLSQHNSCHPCFLNAPISSLSLGPLLHSLLCVSLIFFVFFLFSFPASLSAVLSLFSSSASSYFLPASFSSFFSLFSFYSFCDYYYFFSVCRLLVLRLSIVQPPTPAAIPSSMWPPQSTAISGWWSLFSFSVEGSLDGGYPTSI